MEWYIIYSDKTKETFIKQFSSSFDARHWVINYLDLSMNWGYDRLNYLLDEKLIDKITVQ